MIRGYSDHAANDRTFLAWAPTGIAVTAFGFIIEKFNLFVVTMASMSSPDAGHRLQLERLSGPLGRYDGFTLILVGIAVIVVAAARLSVPGGCWMTRSCIPPVASAELILSVVLALIVAGFTTFLVVG